MTVFLKKNTYSKYIYTISDCIAACVFTHENMILGLFLQWKTKTSLFFKP